jgi:hypothetical protein
MANKPIKFFSDALFKRAIIKEDAEGNRLFEVSGTLADGVVKINVPLSASSTYINGDLDVSGSVRAKEFHVTTVSSSVIYETSISASINALNDVSASNAVNDDYLKYRDGYWVPSPLDLQGALEAVKNANNRLKYQKIDYFDASGAAEIVLPLNQLGGIAFPPASIDYVMYDIAVKDEGEWQKHMVYSQLYISNDELHITIEASALNETYQYKVIAVNTNPDDLVI